MYRFILLLTLCSSIFGELTEKAHRAQMALDGIDSVIEKAIADFNIPGIAVGVVVDGKVIYAKGFGERNREERLPVTTDTLFPIASCSKAFTSFVMATLVEEQKLSWDQPVADVLPGLRLWDSNVAHNITFRDTLSHRTGMARHPWMWYNSNFSREELLSRLRYLEPAWGVRERFVYNDLMFLVAAMGMEQATGKRWEDLVAERILKPLGMESTNLSVEQMQKSDDFALPYIEKNDVLKPMHLRDCFSTLAPACGINTNLNDLTQWVKMLLGWGTLDGKTYLSPGSLQELFAAQMVGAGYSQNKDVLMNSYGLGWWIHPYRNHYSVSHDGGLDGFTSVVSLYPEEGVGIVILSNKNPINMPRYLSMDISDRVLGLTPRNWLSIGLEQWENTKKAGFVFYEKTDGMEDMTPRKKGTVTSHPLEDYVGFYEHPGYGVLEVTLNDGKLNGIYNGITSTLDHWHYDVFSLSQDSNDLLISREGMKFSFRHNSNGDISELIVPFEAMTSEIVFKKLPDSKFSNPAYFAPYIGQYEIYGVVVEIAVRDRGLVAIIPGQPVYELESVSEDEFNVKNNNYIVRFVKGDDGRAKEVLLIAPFGAYSADRVD